MLGTKLARELIAQGEDGRRGVRLNSEIGLVSPVEFEEQHYRHNPAPTPRQFRAPSEPGTRQMASALH